MTGFHGNGRGARCAVPGWAGRGARVCPGLGWWAWCGGVTWGILGVRARVRVGGGDHLEARQRGRGPV